MADSSHTETADHALTASDHTGTVEVPAGGHHDAHADAAGGTSLITPEAKMVILTWITFGVVAALLYKIAWKPILAGLETREAKIRKSVDDAEAARAALAGIEQTRKKIVAETEKEAKAMIAGARVEATKAAAQVELGAHAKVAIMYENAQRDIDAIKHKTIDDLRREQADVVLSLAARLIGEHLDTDKNRDLTNRLIAEL